MAKAVYLHDINSMIQPLHVISSAAANDSNHCSATFRHLLATTNLPGTARSDYSSLAHPSSTVRSSSTARRLQSTRARMASYRHDLLISLRLVNSLERELVQAEYENWVVEESARCEEIRVVLERYSDGGSHGKKTGGWGVRRAKEQATEKGDVVMVGKRLEMLREVLEGYCGDCRVERESLGV